MVGSLCGARRTWSHALPGRGKRVVQTTGTCCCGPSFAARMPVAPRDRAAGSMLGGSTTLSCTGKRPVACSADSKSEVLMWEALRMATDEEMERDATVCVMGARLLGGPCPGEASAEGEGQTKVVRADLTVPLYTVYRWCLRPASLLRLRWSLPLLLTYTTNHCVVPRPENCATVQVRTSVTTVGRTK